MIRVLLALCLPFVAVWVLYRLARTLDAWMQAQERKRYWP